MSASLSPKIVTQIVSETRPMCIFKCVGVLRIHLQMHAAKLKEQSSSPKLKKKLRRYYLQEASCSLIVLCTDLLPGTQ